MKNTVNIDSQSLTRRDALRNVIQATVGVTLPIAPSCTASEPLIECSNGFVLENDYPFFGWEPELKDIPL